MIKTKLQSLLGAFFPYAVLGIAAVLTLTLLSLFAYVLLWGVVVGAILFAGFAIKNYFFPKKSSRIIKGWIIKR